MFTKRSPHRLFFITFIIILLLVFVSPGLFLPLRHKIASGISVPAGLMAWPVLELKKFLLYHKTYDDYLKLRREYDALKSRVIDSEEIFKENARLSGLLGVRKTLGTASTAAHVIARDLSNWESSVLVDKGSKDGVQKGDPVVAASGVLGRVAEASGASSRVMLLTDPQFSVAGKIKSSQQSVLVSGSLNGRVRIRYAQAQDSIQPGDEVVTSRLSASFPENLLIGQVAEAHPDVEGSEEFTVVPAADTSNLQEVLILLQRTSP